ncbi:MAG TPA: glycosyltransferase [Herpetosiphonaceae bacterium]|nr:glycosyltransferase [Herpetosiphonaceae bacterium]
MRILFLTPYPAYPPHGGGVQRMFQLIKQLSQRHELWCLSLSPSAAASAAAQPLARWCHLTLVPAPRRTLAGRAAATLLSPWPDMALRTPSAAYRAALLSLLRSVSFDVVQAESIEMAGYAIMAQAEGAWATLDQWNAEYVLQQRAAQTDLRQARRWHAGAYSSIQWRKLARFERRVCNQLDQVYVVSAEDADALAAIGIARPPVILPNGVDTRFFSPPERRQPDPDLLLFTGTLDFRPNIDALRWFVSEVLPLVRERRPTARLRVVGRAPGPAVRGLAAAGAVEIVGPVDDVRPHFAAAAAYVLPMRIGGGVRLKLLEALATATPLISTTMGADGVEGLRAGQHCLLADSAGDFADRVVEALADQGRAGRMAESGRRFAVDQYDWNAIVPRLEQAWLARNPRADRSSLA